MKYEIPEANMEKLEKKLATIKRKCEKYSCPFTYKVEGELFKEVPKEGAEGKETEIRRYLVVEAEGKAIVNDWQFVATIQHTENGNVIRNITDYEVPKRYYTSEPICEHCQSKRRRKDTYLVYNQVTNEWKQVGKSCLLDFTRGLDATFVANYLSFLDDMEEATHYGGGMSCPSYTETETWLRYAAETYRKLGYVSTSNYYATSTLVQTREFYHYDTGRIYRSETRQAIREFMNKISFNPDSPEAKELVENALEWLRNEPDRGEYIHNLKVTCLCKYTESRSLGIVTSLFIAYEKAMGKIEAKKKREEEAKKQEETSVHVGNVGERITVEMVSCKPVTSWYTDFGLTYLYKMVDKNGNVYTWKTQKEIAEKEWVVKGTVKAHNEFRNVKQTELTRCKVM